MPTPLHAQVTIAALRAGKHVLCENTLRRWQKRQERGTLDDVPVLSPKVVLLAEDEAHLVAQLQGHPDATVDEHLRLWQHAGHKKVSRVTLGRAILRVGWTRKKRA